MTKSPLSFRETGPRFVEAWNSFFHAPADPRVGALVRIVYAGLLLTNLAMWARDLEAWFGESGVLPLEISRLVADRWSVTIFQILPTENWVLWACYLIFVAQAFLMLIGFCSRINAACVFVWLVSFQQRNMLIWDGEDTVFRLLGFFLIFAPINETWSIDCWLWPRGEDEPPPSQWGLRMLQIQMCLIYFSAAYMKLYGGPWLDGTALYYVSRLDDYFGRFPAPNFLWENPWAVRLGTWSVIAAELLVPIFIWFREARLWSLAAVLFFHLGCDWTMHLFLFHWIMLCGWLAFLTGDDLDWIAARVGLATRAEEQPSGT